MSTKHTPGPGCINGSNVYAVDGFRDIPIAQPCINPGIFADEANARLIAAAPDLLKALESLASSFEVCLLSPPSTNAVWREVAGINLKYARAAIAKSMNLDAERAPLTDFEQPEVTL